MAKFFAYGNEMFVNGLAMAVLVTLGIFAVAKISKELVKKGLKRKLVGAPKDAVTTYSFTAKIIIITINVIALITILLQIQGFQKLGTALLGASGVLAVVLGLAAQQSMANIFGGFFLSYFRPFNVGDLINIPSENLSGVVLEIGLRHTEIKTFNNSKLIIPNSIMNNVVVENKDKDIPGFCNFLFFDISYDSDVDKAIAIIQKNAMNHEFCLDKRTKKEKEDEEPIVKVFVTALKEYSIELRASIMTKDVRKGFIICSDLRKEIIKDFSKNGIRIPFPTRIVHTDKK